MNNQTGKQEMKMPTFISIQTYDEEVTYLLLFLTTSDSNKLQNK